MSSMWKEIIGDNIGHYLHLKWLTLLIGILTKQSKIYLTVADKLFNTIKAVLRVQIVLECHLKIFIKHSKINININEWISFLVMSPVVLYDDFSPKVITANG